MGTMHEVRRVGATPSGAQEERGPRDWTGVLYLQEEAERRSDRSPTHRGRIVVGGTTFRLSGWLKTTADGKTFISLAVNQATPDPPRAA